MFISALPNYLLLATRLSGPTVLGNPVGKRILRLDGFVEKVGFEFGVKE